MHQPLPPAVFPDCYILCPVNFLKAT